MKAIRAKREQEDQIIQDASKAAQEGSPAKSVTKQTANLQIDASTKKIGDGKQSPQFSDEGLFDEYNKEQEAYEDMLA